MQISIDNFIEYINIYYLKNKRDIDNTTNSRTGYGGLLRIIYVAYKDIINLYYGKLTIDESIKDSNNFFIGSVVILKDDIINKKLFNIKRINFNKMYPYIIIKLLDEGKLKLNIKELHYIYKFIVENYDNIINNDNFNKDALLFLKSLINGLCGVIMSYFNINVNDRKLIMEYPKKVLLELFTRYDYVYYVDTDIIYLKEFNNNIKNELDQLELPYNVENVLCSYFIQKKRYITEYNGKIKNVGISKSYKKHYNITYEFNDKLRLNKIKKIYNNV